MQPVQPPMRRVLRTYKTTYVLPEGGDSYEPDGEPWEDTYDVVKWGNLTRASTLEQIVEAAMDGIRSEGCETHFSSDTWQPAGWYAMGTYKRPLAEVQEEKTLHLEGFTEQESRAIYDDLRKRGQAGAA